MLSNYELWDYLSSNDNKFLLVKDSLININNLLDEPILVKNILNLFDILLDINPQDNNIKNKQYLNVFSNINQNLSKNIMSKTYEIITEKMEFPKNTSSAIEFIKKPERIIEFKELTQIGLNIGAKGTLYSLCKFEDNKIITVCRANLLRLFSYDKNTFRKNYSFKEIEIKGISEIEDTNNVNYVKILEDNSIILCCTTPKIIRLTIIQNEAKIVQIIIANNFSMLEFDYNKLITSTNTNIIIWERNSDNNYSYKQNISTGNNTNLVYINSNLFASYIYDNTIRFYDKNFNENGSTISNVSSYIEPLMMTMLNEEILGVCGRGNSIIYLININTRKVIKEVKFKDFSSDYLSI